MRVMDGVIFGLFILYIIYAICESERIRKQRKNN